MKRLYFPAVVFVVLSLQMASFAFSQELKMSQDYIVHPSDILEISIYGETDMVRELVVRPDGNVSFPLVGDIKVAGQSTSEVKKLIDEKVSTYIPQASSTVIVKSLGSLKYYVVGEVGNPGMFNVSTQINVLQALSLAGGMRTFADQDNIKIIRGHGIDTKQIPFNYSEAKKGKNLEQNILLKRGDVVLVP